MSGPVVEGYRISPQQKRLWSLGAGDATFCVEGTVLVEGRIDTVELRRALVDVVRRHEILRSTFRRYPGLKTPVQVVGEPVDPAWRLVDLGAHDAKAREARLAEVRSGNGLEPFDLEAGPLWRNTWVTLAPERHLWILTLSALVADGLSLRLLVEDVSRCYERGSAERGGSEEIVQYAQFAEWQREILDGEEGREGRRHWEERLASRGPDPPLPIERREPSKFRPELIEIPADARVLGSIEEASRKLGLPPEDFFLACWQVLLGRLGSATDVRIGLQCDGRKYEELQDVIGLFARTVPLSCRLDFDRTMVEAWSEATSSRREVGDWQEYFSWENDAQGGASPDLDGPLPVGYEFHDQRWQARCGPAQLTLRSLSSCLEPFELKLVVARGERCFAVNLAYDADRIVAGSAETLAARFGAFLEHASERLSSPIGELDLLTPVELRELLVELNDNRTPYPEENVFRLFEARAAHRPDSIGLQYEDEQLSYEGLRHAAEGVAARLQQAGVGRDDAVALLFERSAAFVVAMLGTLRCGACYVPLDPAQPRERLRMLLEDVQPKAALTLSRLASRLPPGGAEVISLDHREPLDREAAPRRNEAEDLAYVMFTSGSTGRPKGVAIEHRQLYNYVSAIRDRLEVIEGASFATVSTPAADLGNTSIFLSLATGGRLHVISEERAFDPEALALYLSRHPVDFLKMVPSHLAAVRMLAGLERVLPQRWLVLGGEACDVELVTAIRAAAPGCRVVNHYGPTETTVGALALVLDDVSRKPSVPLGRPLSNTDVYLLDPHLRPVPFGVQGELHIGGAGLARGYWRRPDLTAERFIPDGLGAKAGGRLYRTGDRCVFLEGPEIHFRGRIDHQVKIHGYRVELGEVEAALARHPGVQQAVVLVRDDTPDQTRLAAFVVPVPGRQIATEELRRFLHDRLPDYMTPSLFVALPRLPLTPNGKVDRRALTVPQFSRPESGREYVAPRTLPEERLAQIWCEVLGVERVGIHDNFFELGGDSILSIQVVARANQVDLRLTPQQLFRHQTIAELARVAGMGPPVRAEQGLVTGSVPLTPIQRWFFEQEPPEPHHWNMAVMLELREVLEGEHLRAAAHHLVAQHDALRMRFARNGSDWEQRNAGLGGSKEVFSQIDLTAVKEPLERSVLEAAAARLQESLDLTAGPLLRATLFTRRGSQRLLVVVHHLVVDGVSWRVLFEDLLASYHQSRRGHRVGAPPKTTSFQEWAVRLREYTRSNSLAADRAYWRQVGSHPLARLPVDGETGENDIASMDTASISLDESETKALLQEVPGVYRTQIDEVLLTALGWTLARWTGDPGVLVELEGHGREPLFDDVDLSRTTGWFTSRFPLRLEIDALAEPGEALKSVKEQVRRVPGRGLGYGILRYLGDDAALRDELASVRPELSFNYLGRLDEALPEAAPVSIAPESVGSTRSRSGRRLFLIDVNGAVAGGRLQMAWSFSRNRHHLQTIERLASDFASSLRRLISHCLSPGAGAFTPSDFPLLRIGQEALDRIVDGDRDLEDIYPLSSLQAGMLFESLYALESAMYFEQISCTLQGPFEPGPFRRAWELSVERHPVLRTGFHWKNLAEPVQVVRRRVSLPWIEEDWRDVGEDERRERLASFLASDRRLGFTVEKPPLMRVALFRLAEDAWRLVWSHHHLILDGWSLPLLLREIMLTYEGLRRGHEVALDRPRPYRDYIAWVRGRIPSATEAYWRGRLSGFTAPTRLGTRASSPIPPSPDRYRVAQLELPPEAASDVDRFARTHRLTPNTLVQGAWSILLSRYSGETDIVYGTTVSGRSVPLPGIDSMLGLFINTLPVRVGVDASLPLVPWLRELQGQLADIRQYEWSPLVEVQRWSGVPRGEALFDALLVFENYPVDRSLRLPETSQLQIRDVAVDERTNFPIAVVVTPAPGMSLQALFDAQFFDSDKVARILAHLGTLLGALIRNPEARLRDLSLLTEGEKHQLLFEWMATERERSEGEWIHEVIERHAQRTPDAVAVTCEEKQLTYGELNRRADALARYLRSLGVESETKVGVCLERSADTMVALFGVLKAGAAYVPLNPSYPADRLSYMAENAGVRVVVTERRAVDRLPEKERVQLDADWGRIAAESRERLPERSAPENLAYVIYTSGSTGRPKGVQIAHGALANFLASMLREPGLSASDVMLGVTTLSFDIAGLELFLPVVAGARTEIVSEEAAMDAELLAERMGRSGVNVAQATPATWRMLTSSGWPGESRLRALCGGEALPRELAETLLGRVGSLWNMYGPTETTIWSTTHAIRPDEGRVRIGRPIASTRVFVLDRNWHPAPVGVPGELHIGGAGLARGYQGAPSMTAERFVPDPHGEEAGERLYRTGDLARWSSKGELEYLGRMDHQVKVRGFRIELGEVESVLGSYPGVKQAVVVSSSETQTLIGYVVEEGEEGLKSGELRRYLQEKLPEYMVPSSLVFLGEIPLTPSGKVDRERLPKPDGERPRLEAEYVAPRTALEEEVTEIWSDVLGVDRVGVHDSFFELGGHSLLAMQLVSRVRERFGVELPLRAAFEATTVAGLSAWLESARQEVGPRIERVRGGEPALSFSQERLWFLDQLVPGSSFYNISVALKLSGALDRGALQATLGEVVRRHEVLRTRFRSDGGKPVPVLEDAHRLQVPVVDLSGLSDDEPVQESARRGREEASRGFDLSRGPLLRVSLMRLAEEEHLALLTMHHIVSDAWSFGVLVREVAALYPAYVEGRSSPLGELPIQYADFARWQRQWLTGEVLERQLAYWREKLRAVPVLELPADRPRPAFQSFRGARRGFELSAELSGELRDLGRRENATAFMTLLAAFQLLLSRMTGQEDVAVGSPIANRTRREIEDLIGFFLNTVVLRTDLSGNPTFREMLRRTRQTSLEAYSHGELPFEKLVAELSPARDLSREPLFQVLFTFQTAAAWKIAGRDLGLAVDPLVIETSTAKFDLTLLLWEQERSLSGSFEFSTDLFDATTIERMAAQFQALLSTAIRNPEIRLRDVSLLTGGERHQLLREWTATERPRAEELWVHEVIGRQAERTPDAVAVIDEDRQVTYRELNRRADRLARYLRSLGVEAETRVGVCLERSVELMVALLGVMKAGGAYVPVDPEYPRERLSYMVEDSGAAVVLSERRLESRLPESGARRLWMDEECDESGEEWNGYRTSGENAAYAIYTSGSTGRPKGVLNRHRGILNRLEWMQEAYGLDGSDRVLQKTPSSFDVSVWEFFWPLMAGAGLVMARPGGHRDGSYLVDVIGRERVTTIHFVPSMLRAFLEEREVGSCQSLKRVMVSGEALSPDLEERFHRLLEAELHNLYGPTEAAVDVSWWNCRRGESKGRIPIGRPITNIRLYVLEREMEAVPVGVAGELEIGGVGLARGYQGAPSLTAERFVPDPHDGEPGGRLYRTGDLARWLPSGELEYLGRLDHQVKVRGFRIELGEVESVLEAHRGVKQAVVVSGGEDRQRLIGYFVKEEGEEAPSSGELRRYLQGKLPEYMVPSVLVELSQLPLTPSGKVDRRRLPQPEGERPELSREYVAPRTALEEEVAGIWREVLGVDRVGIHDDFFELGGHSLLATQVVSRIRQRLQIELPLRELFEQPTVGNLARAVERVRGGDGIAASAAPIPRRPRGEAFPLSFAQERLWFLDQLVPNNPFYSVPVAVRLEGPLVIEAIEETLSEIVRRHEILRTSFSSRGGLPVQIVRDVPEGAGARRSVPVPLVDLGGLPGPVRETEARRLSDQEAQRPFDLERGPLLRCRILRLAPEEHMAIFTMHHIVCDAWSLGVLVREVAALYAAIVASRPSPLEELPIQYGDFATWQREWLRGQVLEEQISYWRERLDGIRVLDLPVDRPRPPAPSFRGASHAFRVDAARTRDLRELSEGEGATLFMTLLAAFQLLLSRYSGQPDVAVGTPIAGRTRVETEGLIGFFLNVLVMRTDLSGELTFRDLLRKVREVALGAYAHQDLPFEKLVEELSPSRDLSREALFQVLLVLQNTPVGAMRIPSGLGLRPADIEAATAKFDLTLFAVESASEIQFRLTYQVEMFESATIERMARHFGSLLEAVSRNPDESLSRLPLFGPAEELLLEAGERESGEPRAADPPSVLDALERVMGDQRDAIALEWGDTLVSFGALDRAVDRLAAALVAEGLGPGSIVANVLGSRIDVVVTLLATLRAGCVFVPLDPDAPAPRLAGIAKDLGAEALVVDRQREDLAREIFANVEGVRAWIHLDWGAARELRARATRHPVTAPAGPRAPEAASYIYYTSGSTGAPKGIVGTASGLSHFIAWELGRFAIEPGWRFSQLTAPTFDAFLRDVLVALTSGGTLCVPPARSTLLDSDELMDWIDRSRITLVHCVPTLFGGLVGALQPGRELSALRYVLMSGEVLPIASVRRWIERYGDRIALVNLYGPTETTLVKFCHLVSPADVARGFVPIGRPIEGAHALILDEAGRPSPRGTTGEIYISTPHRTLGYHGNPELTRRSFVPNPFHSNGDPAEIAYRTGDLGRLLNDGTYQFLGRRDGQVKIRGVRVELAEVEGALAESPSIAQAVVAAREGSDGRASLVAYFIARPGHAPTTSELHHFLKGRLPESLLPAAFVQLTSFPLTSSGKVDRRQLPAPERVRPELASSYEPARTPTEQALVEIWSEVLGREQIGIHDNFFELGGHSLLATQVVSRIRQVMGSEIALRRVFEAPTIHELASSMERAMERGEARPALRLRRVRRTEEIPLSFAQQRLWFFEQLNPGTFQYNIPIAVRLRAPLDVRVAERSLNEVARRQESLRTSFRTVQGRPIQVISEALRLRIPLVDLAGLAPERRDALARELAREEGARPFDIAAAPLIRVRLLRLAERDHAVLFTMHHIVSDAWSMERLVQDFLAVYTAFAEGRRSPLPELPIQYADFAVAQREWLTGEVLDEQLSFWRKRLEDVPVLNLPTDRPRPRVQSFRGGMLNLGFPSGLAGALTRLSQAEGATLFMTMVAAFQSLLAFYTGQHDIAVGTNVANRSHAETEPLIGFFINQLVLRSDLEGDPSFRELLSRVRRVTLDSYAHQDLPFERLVEELHPERDLSRSLLFQAKIDVRHYADADEAPAFADISAGGFGEILAVARHDLYLVIRVAGTSMSGTLAYAADLFDVGTMEIMLSSFQALLQEVVAEPEARLSRLNAFLLEHGRRERARVEAALFEARARMLKEARGRRRSATLVADGKADPA
jgi:amino acid adenylation domain-containing protein/non-ribosomal peptide synthase protein (TIGR01720 family)